MLRQPPEGKVQGCRRTRHLAMIMSAPLQTSAAARLQRAAALAFWGLVRAVRVGVRVDDLVVDLAEQLKGPLMEGEPRLALDHGGACSLPLLRVAMRESGTRGVHSARRPARLTPHCLGLAVLLAE